MIPEVWGCLEAPNPEPPSLSHDPTLLQSAAPNGESQSFSILPTGVFLHLPYHDPIALIGGREILATRLQMRWWAGTAGDPKHWVTALEVGQEVGPAASHQREREGGSTCLCCIHGTVNNSSVKRWWVQEFSVCTGSFGLHCDHNVVWLQGAGQWISQLGKDLLRSPWIVLWPCNIHEANREHLYIHCELAWRKRSHFIAVDNMAHCTRKMPYFLSAMLENWEESENGRKFKAFPLGCCVGCTRPFNQTKSSTGSKGAKDVSYSRTPLGNPQRSRVTQWASVFMSLEHQSCN